MSVLSHIMFYSFLQGCQFYKLITSFLLIALNWKLLASSLLPAPCILESTITTNNILNHNAVKYKLSTRMSIFHIYCLKEKCFNNKMGAGSVIFIVLSIYLCESTEVPGPFLFRPLATTYNI